MLGLKPFRGTASGIKPENSFSALSPLSPTVARGARHSHPSLPEKSRFAGKKVGSAEKNCGYGGLRVTAWRTAWGMPVATVNMLP